MSVSIRQAVPFDAEQLLGLLRRLECFSLSGRDRDEALKRTVRQIVQARDSAADLLLVAENAAGSVVGYAAAHWFPSLLSQTPEGYVSELFVDREYRGRGVGSQLMDAAESAARERGCVQLSLLNHRDRESYERQFYEKRGWVEQPDFARFVRRLDADN